MSARRNRHSFSVELRIERPDSAQRLSLPAWIPGSYLVREFARHLSGLTAEQGGAALPLEQLDKATWLARAAPPAFRSSFATRCYAFDTSVRAAFLDVSRGFFNGTGVCLRVEGTRRRAARPRAARPARRLGRRDDARAAPRRRRARVRRRRLRRARRPPGRARPVLARPLRCGAVSPHEFVVAGALPDFDGERLARRHEAPVRGRDRVLARQRPRRRSSATCSCSTRSRTAAAASSTARARRWSRRGATCRDASRAEPAKATPAKTETSDGYVGVLGLIAHEYFHAWNVKRLKPREFATFDYAGENYTRLLWFFEGFTSYYDDLFVLRAGLIDAPRYLKLLATTISSVQASPGRLVQSVADAELRCLGQVLPRRREHAERDDQLLRQGLARRARLRPDLARRRQGLARRRHAPAVAEERRRSDRRSGHRRRARGRRRPLVRARDGRVGARHRRAAAGGAAAALRRRGRSAAGDARAAPRRSRQRERAHRRQGHATCCATAPASAPGWRRATS